MSDVNVDINDKISIIVAKILRISVSSPIYLSIFKKKFGNFRIVKEKSRLSSDSDQMLLIWIGSEWRYVVFYVYYRFF